MDALTDLILNTPKKLSKSQQLAVLSDNRHVRIIAGAGAGKTETLTRKILFLLLHENIDPSAIVAFTFTEKAAQSMKSRIYDRLKSIGKEDICARLGDMYVGTIHGYCVRILEDHFNYGNYSVLDENQEMAFLLRSGWEIGLGEERNYTAMCEKFLETMDVTYSEMIPDIELEKRAPNFYKYFINYRNLLEKDKLLTFDRLIDLAIQNLSTQPEMVNNVQFLIVDEYQDINKAQEKLINIIGEHAGIFVVGDPRQTVYQWRGSDERCFEHFCSNYQDADNIQIRENRRSKKRIIDIANDFSDSFEKEKYDHLEPLREDDDCTYIVECSTNIVEAEWIAEQIQNYVDSGKCDYKDIGLLFRSVSTSAPVFIDVFRTRQIPLIIGGKVGLFRRPEIQAVAKLCIWLYDGGFFKSSPYDRNSISGDALLETALDDIHEGLRDINLNKDINSLLREWKAASQNGEYEHFTEIFQRLLVVIGFKQLDPGNPLHAASMANIGRFNELLTDFETASLMGGRKRKWDRDFKGLHWFINAYATSSYEEQVSEDNRGINAVQMLTVHQAKGLEWPVVFIPSLVKRRFPSTMVGREREWMIPRDMFNAEKYDGDLDSERKLLYVALTRPKDLLVISYFQNMNGNRVNESDFLDEINTDLIRKITDRDELSHHSLTLGGDPDELQTYTTGEILSYSRCPFQYRMKHIWGYQPGLKERVGYGNALHFCLRNAAGLIKGGLNPITAVATSVDEHFHLPFMNEKVAREIQQAAKKKLLQYTMKHTTDMKNIKEVETRIEFPMQRSTVAGKVDVIIHNQNELEIRDYKTSDKVISQHEAEMQVRLYTLGLSMIGEHVTKASIAYLDDAHVTAVSVTESDIEKARQEAEEYIAGIMNRNFGAMPGEHCTECDYHLICKYTMVE